MKQLEKGNAEDTCGASVIRPVSISEQLHAKGQYFAQCFDKDGNLKWEDTIDNVVTDVGANQLLDSAFGSGPVAGPFLGLISSVGYTGIPVAADTMLSHASGGHVWFEAGNGSNYPNWSTPASNARATVTFAAASGRSKSLTAAVSFVGATNAGTVKGCFLVMGSGASATNNSTAGVLYSAGVFTLGDKILGIGDTLNVTYATSV